MNIMKRIYLQIIFWLIIAGINIGFGIYFLPIRTVILTTLFVLFFQALVFYINTILVFPRIFSMSNIWRFIFFSAIFILLITMFQSCADYYYFSKIIFKEFTYKPPFLTIFMRSFFWLTFIDMISTLYMMQDHIRKQAEQTQQIKAEKLDTELKLLKAQINPHFLFNTLNNIYSLTYMKSEKAPESVLKLSQMLRYVIEDCTREKVALESEIEYIENYIAFQKMKTPDVQNVTFEYSKAKPDVLISPMLFIPFIENSYKYSKIDENPDAWIHIELTTTPDTIGFQVRNYIPASNAHNHGSGTGIENVKKRLEIMYPDRHSLLIKHNNHEYQVYLGISVK